MEVKVCKKCGLTKYITEFYRNGKDNICKKCDYERKKPYSKKRYNEIKNKIQGNFVYRLILDNKIIYIGKSEHLYLRIKQHSQDKTFDRVEAIKFKSTTDMYISEIYFINKYKPVLNKDYVDDNNESIKLDALDCLQWLDIEEYYNIRESEKTVARNTIMELLNSIGSGIDFHNIRSCFARKRSKNYLVYIEYDNKKQKKVKTFTNKISADKFVLKLKESIQEYKRSIIEL